MKKANLENVFSQLSNVDNINDVLRDEGLIPDQIVNNGLERLNEIQFTQISKKKLVEILKMKVTESITNEAKKAVEALRDLIPSMNGQQVSMVFRSLNNPSEKEINMDQLVRGLRSDTDLLKIMKKHNPGEEN